MTMTRDELIAQRGKAWKRLEALLAASTVIERPNPRRVSGLGLTPSEVRELSELYRSLAADLMQVRRDKLGVDLERHLDTLASRSHNLIYAKGQAGDRLSLLGLLADFPGAVRRNRFFLLAFFLFFGPLFIAGAAAYSDESYAMAILSSEQLERSEEMYRSASPDKRNVNTDSAMTGFYVHNNVGIAFTCFATGILYGLGSLFYILFNGLYIGVILGHLIRAGLAEPILSFISTHGPWELVAIVISGSAGVQMGFAMVKTNGRTRIGNLHAHRLELLRQILGAAAFLLVAALLEGNFSPSALPAMVKYVAGGIGWLMVGYILMFGGRRRTVPPDAQTLGGRRPVER